ncbi:unnamed protein product [Heterobilharzia americana]|nr:unnamed protein product [Heterobilharzia americana]
MVGDFNAQVGKLSQSERHLGGIYGIPCQRNDNGGRQLQFCHDNHMFLVSHNCKHMERHCLTWCPPTSNQRRTQRDHFAIAVVEEDWWRIAAVSGVPVRTPITR